MKHHPNPLIPVFDGPEFVGWERECPYCLEETCDCVEDEEGGT